MSAESSSHFRTCNLCEAMCGLVITQEEGNITSIKGDPNDPFSQGFICPKAVSLQDIHKDPDRLKKPVRRTGNGWEEISWEEAFDEVCNNIESIRKQYGPDALGVYFGNPSVHNIGSMLFSPLLLRQLRTKNRFSATSVDQLPHQFASQEMFGHLLMIPIPDIDRTQYFLVMGANPMASNGSMMTAPGMPNRIKNLQERGGKMVVIDPRRSETAEKADRHHFIKPGTDVYFLAGLVQVMLNENLVNINELPDWISITEDLSTIFQGFDLERVAKITGITAEEIRKVANELVQAESSVIYGRMGLSTQAHGTLCQWLINLLNCITGNLDKPGGVMFTSPAVDIVKYISPKSTMHRRNRWKSRVRGLYEFGSELPAVTMADEILTEGEGQIKALLVSAGNPVLSTPNGKKLDKALGQLEFMVSIDIYINETSRHANIILPPATGLESSHYDLVFHNLAIRNTAKFAEPLFELENGAMYDWQIMKALIKRFGSKRPFMEKLLFPMLTPERILDRGLKRGPHKLSIKKLKNHPHGLDLGPLVPRLPERLFTPDKKVYLTPQVMVDGLKALRMDPSSNGQLTLIGRRHLRSNNSWMHNSHRLVKGPERCTLLINPEDADRISVKSGEMVKVTSRAGSLKIVADVSDEMMPGVVSIPHGWGHHLEGVQLNIAKEHAGVSVNDLTDEQLIDQISGNADLSGVKVSVEVV